MLDINNATAQDLAEMGGISLEVAQTIVEYRNEMGGFNSLDELVGIPGCNQTLVDRLREAGVGAGAAADVDGEALM